MGEQDEKEKTMEGLNNAKGMIRTLLAKRLNMRNTPELTFILDESLDYGLKMSKLIDEVNAPLHEREENEDEESSEENN
jgi:ribosome-binding factor A